MIELVPLWRRAITAEVCWLDHVGEPAALAVTPLVAEGVPCVAVPYCLAAEVAGLRESGRVAFAVTDSRSLRTSGRGVVCTGRAEVTDDTTGEYFTVELLGQELAKYPPSRTLADSPLLCRENWWWLPRIIVRLADTGPVRELPARTNPDREALLVRERDDALSIDTVDVVDTLDTDGSRLALRAQDGGSLRGDGAPGLTFGYDYTMPDLERWETWSVRGTLLGDELEVKDRHGEPGTALPPLRLMERIRRQRSLERGCKRHILAQEKRR